MSNLRRDLRRAQRRMLFLTMRSVMRRFGFDSARRIGAWLGALQYLFGRDTRRTCLEGLAALGVAVRMIRKSREPCAAPIA